jgi:hypothetical protein
MMVVVVVDLQVVLVLPEYLQPLKVLLSWTIKFNI